MPGIAFSLMCIFAKLHSFLTEFYDREYRIVFFKSLFTKISFVFSYKYFHSNLISQNKFLPCVYTFLFCTVLLQHTGLGYPYMAAVKIYRIWHCSLFRPFRFKIACKPYKTSIQFLIFK